MLHIIIPNDFAPNFSMHKTLAELHTPDGRVLGYFTPYDPNFAPQITQEEAELRLAEGGGRKLSEILCDLENRK